MVTREKLIADLTEFENIVCILGKDCCDNCNFYNEHNCLFDMMKNAIDSSILPGREE